MLPVPAESVPIRFDCTTCLKPPKRRTPLLPLPEITFERIVTFGLSESEALVWKPVTLMPFFALEMAAVPAALVPIRLPWMRLLPDPADASTVMPWPTKRLRSEEHTSELQSQFQLVCRLLLETKKIK